MAVHRLKLRKPNKILFGVTLDVFKTDVGVFFDRADMIRYVRTNFDIELDDSDFSDRANAEAGAVFNDQDVPYFYILFNDDNPRIGIVAHECVHVAGAICDSLGVPVNRENDETLAYMVDYLVQSVVDEVQARNRQ